MRYSIRIILLMTIATLAIIGCAKYIYKTQVQHFNHKVHKDILAKSDFECLDCHKFLKVKDRMAENEPKKSGATLYPRMAICHYCHVDAGTRVESAPYECRVCHEDMFAIRPVTHTKEWKQFHAPEAKNDRQACASCHNDRFCSDCHTRRDKVQSVMHSKPYRYFHSVEAQINPASCNSCHAANFCIECHSGKKRRY